MEDDNLSQMHSDSPIVELIGSLQSLAEILTPMQDYAKTRRETLIQDGWSPHVAEAIAADGLIMMQRQVISGSPHGHQG